MKGTRRTLLIVVTCAVVVFLATVLWPSEREPAYQGKKLSDWLAIYRHHIPGTDGSIVGEYQGRGALRQIGTNGLPFLVRWIKCEPPRWKMALFDKYVKLPYRFRPTLLSDWLRGAKEYERGHNGMVGLSVLGGDAAAAIPDLRHFAAHSSGRDAWNRVVTALANMGDEGQRALLDLARSPEGRMRYFFVLHIGTGLRRGWFSVATRDAALALMADCLQDKDWKVRNLVAQDLGWLRPYPEGVVPALIKGVDDPVALVRAACVEALGNAGSRARIALPRLMEAQRDVDLMVRDVATNAVRSIALEVRQAGEKN